MSFRAAWKCLLLPINQISAPATQAASGTEPPGKPWDLFTDQCTGPETLSSLRDAQTQCPNAGRKSALSSSVPLEHTANTQQMRIQIWWILSFPALGWVFPLKSWRQYYYFFISAHRSNLLITEEVWNVNNFFFFLFSFFFLFPPAFWTYIHIQEESGTKQLQTFSGHSDFELSLYYLSRQK